MPERVPPVHVPETPDLEPNEWAVDRDFGLIQASRDGRALLIEGQDGAILHRCGLTYRPGQPVEHSRMLRASLGDVHLYVLPDGSMILTRRDLYP